jgi:hypothetical protein
VETMQDVDFLNDAKKLDIDIAPERRGDDRHGQPDV